MTGLFVDEGRTKQNEEMRKEKFLNGNGAPHTNGTADHPANGDSVRINGNGAHTVNGKGAFHINGCSAGHDDENVIVRRYKPEDRAAIRRICCDTGFLGNPIETIFTDREIFADLFTNPYLNYGADCAWVAEDGGRVVGYLLGSVSPFVQLCPDVLGTSNDDENDHARSQGLLCHSSPELAFHPVAADQWLSRATEASR